MPKRICLSAVLVVSSLVLAAVSNAASVSISTDKATYSIGETVTLTVTADSEGDVGQVVDISVRFDATLLNNPTGAIVAPDIFTQANGGFAATRSGNEGTCGGIFGADGCNAFDQLLGNIPPIDPGPKLSILEFTAAATGTAAFSFLEDRGSSGSFMFAGLDPPDISHSIRIVPEPAAGALIGLGLLGLGWGRSRRQQQATLDRRAGPGRPHGSS